MAGTLTAAGSSTPTNVLSADPTQVEWAQQVLTDGGWPVTQNNMVFMLDWMASENSPSTWTGTAGANNPLNNGLYSGGGSGLGSYPSLYAAAAAAAANLATGANGYAAVTQLLAQGTADPSAIANAMWQSSWALGHYGFGSGWNTSAGAAFAAGTLGLVASSQSAANGATGGVATTSAQDVSILSQAGGILGKIIDPLGLIPGAQKVVKALSGAAGVEAEAIKLAEDLTNLNWWKRVGVFILGGIVFGVGVAVFVTSSKPSGGKQATETKGGDDKGGGDGDGGDEGGGDAGDVAEGGVFASLAGMFKSAGAEVAGAAGELAEVGEVAVVAA